MVVRGWFAVKDYPALLSSRLGASFSRCMRQQPLILKSMRNAAPFVRPTMMGCAHWPAMMSCAHWPAMMGCTHHDGLRAMAGNDGLRALAGHDGLRALAGDDGLHPPRWVAFTGRP
jgi:hypothetical protein